MNFVIVGPPLLIVHTSGAMSKSVSGSRKISSLAKCYDYCKNKKWSKKYEDGGHSKSAVAGVVEKLDEAIKKNPTFTLRLINMDGRSWLGSAAQDGGGPAGGQSGASDPSLAKSQDGSVAEASGATALSIDGEVKKNMAAFLIDPKQLWEIFFSGFVTDDLL